MFIALLMVRSLKLVRIRLGTVLTPKGKLASLVQLKVDSKPTAGQLEKIEKFAHTVCIQIVGGKPNVLSKGVSL